MVPPDFIRSAVGHFLALGHQTGLMPPFGLLQFLEAVGVSSVQPELVSAASLLDRIPDGRAISANRFDHLLADGYDLMDDYGFLESWFEVGDGVNSVLSGNRAAREKRAALIMEKVLEPRREWWTQEAAWRPIFCISLAAMNDGRNFMQRPWPWSKSARCVKSP